MMTVCEVSSESACEAGDAPEKQSGVGGWGGGVLRSSQPLYLSCNVIYLLNHTQKCSTHKEEMKRLSSK